MRTVSDQQLGSLIENIVREKEQKAKVVAGMKFFGVTPEELLAEINKRIGKDWVVKRVNLLKLNKDDFNAIANSRFYRQTGLKLLMLFGIVILVLAMLTVNFHIIPPYVYYGVCIAVSFGFVYLFSRKRNRSRKEFNQSIGIEGESEEPEKGK